MSSPNPTPANAPVTTPAAAPVTTQPPPPPLSRALDLLDGLLLRTDVPSAVLLDLGDVFGDLFDVRPPYTPTTPTTSTDPWPLVLDQVVAALHDLITNPSQDAPPARSVGYALNLRTLRQHQTPPPDTGPATPDSPTNPTTGTTTDVTADLTPGTTTDPPTGTASDGMRR
ncbi:hypothetical protein [Aquipuribacter hungaricus]|uniref:Uncharacterized protein n=1 Tax=Aquipuribacter hungaricus TaxID=545624 RepID=A0ABV7WEH0_9MICO